MPENVYTFYENEMNVFEYYIVLDYTSSGWVVRLQMPLFQHDEVVGGCPTEAFASFWLWSPDDQDMAQEYGFLNYQGPLKSIEEATSMTIEEFFRVFSDPSSTQCLETPVVTTVP
jgi:hypothetical protein